MTMKKHKWIWILFAALILVSNSALAQDEVPESGSKQDSGAAQPNVAPSETSPETNPAATGNSQENAANSVPAAADIPTGENSVAQPEKKSVVSVPLDFSKIQLPQWFKAKSLNGWYERVSRKTNRKYLGLYFKSQGYEPPAHTYAMIAPLKIENGRLAMQYFSYGNTAFTFSMTPDGVELYWPASTVKLMASVLALMKLSEYGLTSKAIVRFDDIEGHYDGTVEELCREAIIPSNNTAYNRLMEIAGFDQINDDYLPKVLYMPKMILQRRYVRKSKADDLRTSPAIEYEEGDKKGVIPERHSSGKMRDHCPRESNCTTLVELAEIMNRVVMHDALPENYRLPLQSSDIAMLQQALREAPSCIGDGVASAMGSNTIIYNKGGKVIGDDRLEIAVVSSPNGKERYLVALSMPYYEGVEKETNELAKQLILAMKAIKDH